MSSTAGNLVKERRTKAAVFVIEYKKSWKMSGNLMELDKVMEKLSNMTSCDSGRHCTIISPWQRGCYHLPQKLEVFPLPHSTAFEALAMQLSLDAAFCALRHPSTRLRRG